MYSKDDIRKRREGLSATKKELLARRLQHTMSGESDWQMIPQRAGEQALPLSFAQQRLWFLQQLEPENPAYNETLTLRLTGSLNGDILQRTLQVIAHRHEILRTTFELVNGSIQQCVHPSGEQKITVSQTELPEGPIEQRDLAIRSWIQQQTQQPFTMVASLLWKATLLRLSSAEHVLCIVMHHLICDSWSLGLFMHELATIYAALSQDMPSLLPAPTVQYGDYTLWQRQNLEGDKLAAHLTYWKEQVAGAPAFLELPTDYPRQPKPSYQEQRLPFQFSTIQAQQLQAASQQEGVTLFMFLIASMAITLARYSRQDDIVIGTSVAGRTYPQLEGVFGLFVNLLALRINLADNPTLHQLLQQVRRLTLEAYAHQDLPFEKLVEEMHGQRLLGQSPFFQVVLDLQHSSLQQSTEAIKEVGGVRIAPMTTESGWAKFDLTWMISENEQGLHGQLIYNSDLWQASSMQRLLTHWQHILQAFLRTPCQRLSNLIMLGPDERTMLLEQWNQTQQVLRPESIPQLFERQVLSRPDSIALVFEDMSLTYGELNRRANQLAHSLHLHDRASETLVAVYLERSPALVIAILAILKAGGTYIPLDPLYPSERLAVLLQDCAAPILLTQEQFRSHLPHYQGTILVIDAKPFTLDVAAHCTQNLSWQPDPQQLAYVIYTSGTTGQPKGVGITQQAVANHLLTMQKTFAIQPEERVLQFAAIAFDVSLEQILTTLISGATLILKDTALWHPHDLTRRIAEMALTVVNLPTAYWHQWLRDLVAASLDDVLPATLKLVIAGGDKVMPEAVWLWFQLFSEDHIRLLNAYGPTEATITSSVFAISGPSNLSRERASFASFPIGYPLPNRTYYVLDRYGEPTPLGVIGELYLGGPLIARGYIDRPELTAERFLPDPFSKEEGARLYRTGDLVRIHADGNLEVVGRADLQVKIRGYRLELGEIEAVLAEYPAVQAAVVVVKEDRQEQYLVAYVTMLHQHTLDVRALSGFLETRLPSYMVPAHIIALDVLPLTPNGKLDRQTLASYDIVPTQSTFVAPQTPLEVTLAEIWCNLLSVSAVGRYDNFFTLGGHSLLAMQCVSRVLQVLQINLPLLAIFACPTLASLAEYIQNEQYELMPIDSLEMADEPTEQAYSLPASFHQQRLWFLDQLQPQQDHYNLSVAVRLDGSLDVIALERSFNEIIRRHESLRTIFAAQKEPQQIILPRLTIALAQQDLRQLDQQARELRSHEALHAVAHRPFNLAEGPLVRTLLLQMQEQEHILLLTMHHSISDGWSIGILLRELLTLYTAFSQGQPSPLAPLQMQYRHYTKWQRDWLQGKRLEDQLAYWKGQLQGAPPLLALPTDSPRSANTALAGSQQAIELAPTLVDQLYALSHDEHVTLFMTLLAAINLFLYRISGQSDLVIGIPHVGRPRAEFEQVIGLFVNMLPIRTNLSDSPTFRQLLQRVHKVSLEAYMHADIPFEKIVQALHLEPNLNYHPLFQVEFAFQNDLSSIEDLTKKSHHLLNLSLHGLPVDIHQVKLDLAFSVTPSKHGLAVIVEYNTGLFATPTITRMLNHFQTLLTEIVLHPDQPITRLALLSNAEREQILTIWSHRVEPRSQKDSFYQRFVQQAAKRPEALAVVCGQQHLTYQAVVLQSQRLACLLATYGVGPGSLVALLGERSSSFLVTILALFRLGAAYMPLDPHAPSQRQQFLLMQSRAFLVLIDHKYRESFLAEATDLPARPPVLVSQDLFVQAQEQKETALEHQPCDHPSQLAYVIYTSGSTGIPKGAMIEQQGMLNHLEAKIQDLELTERDIVAQTASQCFDISVWQFLAPLLVGGSVHILSDEIAHNPFQLLHYVKQQKITIFETVPSLLRVALEEIAQHREIPPLLPSVRWLLLTGEALPPDLCRQWQQHYPLVRLLNAYGPTECSDDVTHYALPATLPEGCYAVPIGRAVANMQIYLLDQEMQPVPIGVIGEVYCGGIGVGRGYLYDPQRTAERFLPDPFSQKRGARFYKTGDLACYLPDGNLEYRGRVDQQVKIRGMRIEPGEIESLLRQQPAIREAVVISRENKAHGPYLAAYVVVHPHQSLEIDTLIHQLERSLPKQIIPTSFVVLPALPLNPNGKIDYAALPEPAHLSEQPNEPVIAPRSATEQVIANIWAEVLKLDVAQIGIERNFFSLGGHSLLAIQAIARLRSIFRLDLSIRSLFEYATIAEFAQYLSTNETKPGQIEKIAYTFQRIERMSENEIHQLLQQKKRNP